MKRHSPKRKSKKGLPNTPRVSGKIMEYYHKFGQDRDLEKFMRLYSPASSQDSQKTQKNCAGIEMDSCMRARSRETISSTSSCEALAKMPSRPLSVCCAANSKSLPNIDVQGQDIGEVIVDINIEMEGDKEKIICISSENIQTPRKVLKETRTHTPESIAKSHRRLEWDSLADVGYKKSMSTSNISMLERSLLKEFFKENSVTSEPCTSQQAKLKELQQKGVEQKTVKCIKNTDIEHSTPPLACSTLVEGYKENSTKRGAKPKMITQSTSSTSLQEKFEKYAQTSLLKTANVQSREIQCTMSSSNSLIEGTATPSSFEYLSSRSSKSSENIIENNSRKQNAPTEHPFITSITDLLKKRKILCEQNQQKHKQLKNIRDLQTKFQAALEENKENQSHSVTASSTSSSSFSLTKQAPELDLGIQLICSLIDAKSVNVRQKKQLIRDIVKRITRLEGGETSQSTISSGAITHSNGSSTNRQNIYDSVHSNGSNKPNTDTLSILSLRESKLMSGVLSDMLVNSELGIAPMSKALCTQMPIENPSTSTSNTSEEIIGARRVSKLHKERSKEVPPTTFHVKHVKGHDNNFPCKTIQFENVLKENNRKVSNVTPNVTCKDKQNDLISKQPIKTANATVKNHKDAPSEIQTKKSTSKSTQTSKISTTTKSDSCKSKTSTKSSSTSCSSTSTQSLTTQRCIVANEELNNSNTDAEQPTMREWLNPLTQSEIEYEEKKREENKRKDDAHKTELKRDKHLRKSSKHDCGRGQQLNWIENEIRRLECLKHLLLKDEHSTDRSSTTMISSTDWASHTENITKESTQTDKLYDTVYSDKSSILSESAERLIKEIEIILEESNEDVINLNNNLKRTKDRKKEIQIVYEKPKENAQQQQQHIIKAKPKFRTIKETITINEEQLLTDRKSYTDTPKQPRQQREKIDTPSTENSPESESLRDLVKQRKREFMEAYKTKKQNHYEALKQQQKEEFKYLNLQNKAKTLEKPVNTIEINHYSIPHTMPRKYVTNELSYAYTQQPLPSSPEDSKLETKSSTAASFQQKSNVQYIKPGDTTTAATTTTSTKTTSSSSTTSMFCISSDVSVPMGSQMTSSTPTTTHQYDDVAAAVAGVAVQTSDSIVRSKPIYGPQMLHFLHSKRLSPHLRPYGTVTTSRTACIQVKPKGIAYVIEFDDNKNSNFNSNSDDINSNIKLIESTSTVTTYPSNNMKSLLPSEPQLTLQDYLEKAKPKFLQHSKERKAILNQLQSMRQERDRKLREIIDNSSFSSLERRLKYLPPPPIQKARILNTKEMKALTNKRFVNLPEVVARKEREMEDKKRRSNRILRDIFNRRLQKRVRNGKLSLNHSKTVI